MHKHYPETDETPMGRLNQTRAHVRSTNPKRAALQESTAEALKALVGKKEKDVYFKIIDTRDVKHTIYSDQTGQFPVRARSGNRYIMVMVEIDSNYVLVQPMKNRTDDEMIKAYQMSLKGLNRAGWKQRNNYSTTSAQRK